MPDDKDILTEEDTGRILRGLVDIAGREGIEEAQLLAKYASVAKHVREMKVSIALYETFETESCLLDVDDDGELQIYSAQRIAARNT